MQGRLRFLHCLIKHENRYFPMFQMIRSIYEKRKILSIRCFYYVLLNQIFVKDSGEKMSRKLHPGSEQIKNGQLIREMNGIWLLSVSDRTLQT